MEVFGGSGGDVAVRYYVLTKPTDRGETTPARGDRHLADVDATVAFKDSTRL